MTTPIPSDLLCEAVAVFAPLRTVTSLRVQRALGIGPLAAERLMRALEDYGVLSSPRAAYRLVLVTPDDVDRVVAKFREIAEGGAA